MFDSLDAQKRFVSDLNFGLGNYVVGERTLQSKVQRSILSLQRFANRIWYPPFIGALAALDNFIIVIPNDGILISSSMLTPKRWIFLALCVAIGSALGALSLAWAVELYGLPWISERFPGIVGTDYWGTTERFFLEYGLILVFFVAVTPLMQQPVVILAALANTPLMELGAIMFLGRLIKFLLMAYLGSHAPGYLKKMWGLKGELEEAGVKIKDPK